MRAQVSAEFMVVLAALLMIFMIIFTASGSSTANLAQSRETVAAHRNAYAAAAALNCVYLAGDGAAFNLSMGGMAEDENITISGFAVTSMRGGASASAPLLDGNVNASGLGRGDILIRNEGGGIKIGG
jgi:hypothetical protein